MYIYIYIQYIYICIYKYIRQYPNVTYLPYEMGKTKTSQVSGITYHKNHVLNKEYKHNIRNVFVATSQAAPPAQFGRFCCFLIVRGSTQQGKQGAKPSGKKGEHPGDLRGPLKLTLDFQENTPVEYVEVL